MSDNKIITWKDDPAHFRKVSRREFLYAGLAGGIGLTMGDLFKLRANETDQYAATAESLIHIYLPGGCAHQETWDPKHLAPIEYRGPLGTVDTPIPGVKSLAVSREDREDRRQAHHRPFDDARRSGARARHAQHVHRLPSVARNPVSVVRSGHQPRARFAQQPAAVRLRAEPAE